MSLERIAEILCVDEVQINHGPKGVAVHVRIEHTWHSAAIDNGDLTKSRGHDDVRAPRQRRLETIAEHLAHLSDAHIGNIRDLRKARADAATRAALQADHEAARARQRFGMSWADVGGFDNPRDGFVQQQLSKSESAPPPTPPGSGGIPDSPAAESMPSRFHAIMAELKCL